MNLEGIGVSGIERGQLIHGEVYATDKRSAYIRILGSAKFDVIADWRTSEPEIGSWVQVEIIDIREAEDTGFYIAQFDQTPDLTELCSAESFEFSVKERVRGGFRGEIRGVEVFLPHSLSFARNKHDWRGKNIIGNKAVVKVVSENRKANNVVVSQVEWEDQAAAEVEETVLLVSVKEKLKRAVVLSIEHPLADLTAVIYSNRIPKKRFDSLDPGDKIGVRLSRWRSDKGFTAQEVRVGQKGTA